LHEVSLQRTFSFSRTPSILIPLPSLLLPALLCKTQQYAVIHKWRGKLCRELRAYKLIFSILTPLDGNGGLSGLHGGHEIRRVGGVGGKERNRGMGRGMRRTKEWQRNEERNEKEQRNGRGMRRGMRRNKGMAEEWGEE
jgi:hypothetical protein